MCYYTFKADSVISALIAIDEIVDNFNDRYGNTFTGYNCQNVRLILESDYDCPKDIVEEAVKIAANDGIFEYTPDIWDTI